MALVFTSLVGPDSEGNRRKVVTSVALDNSYTTGGYVLTPQNLGLSRVDVGDVNLKTTIAVTGPGAGYLDCTNPAVPLLKFQSAGHVGELAPAAAVTGAVAVVMAWGEL